MATELLIVADDLTGALDSAAPFIAAGRRVAVARRPDALKAAAATGSEVLAVATATREGTAEAAQVIVAALKDTIQLLAPAAAFKKVDSRLKGHVAVETAALAELVGATSVLACPAIPDLGRVVRAGQVVGTGVPEPIAVAQAFQGNRNLKVADAATADDLDAMLAEAPTGTLFAGARGLSGALARSFRHGADACIVGPEAWPEGPTLLAIGSRDPLTLAQIAGLQGTVHQTEAPGGVFRTEGVTEALAGGAALVRMSGGGTDDKAGGRFAASVAEVVRQGKPAVLFACGGETADAILAACGIDVLQVVDEPLPGVVRSRARTATGPIEVVTKSGGFGPPDLLTRIMTEFIRCSGHRGVRRTA